MTTDSTTSADRPAGAASAKPETHQPGHAHQHYHDGVLCDHDHSHAHHGHHQAQPGVTMVRQGPKVGRNDPCPCGSGKKHKKCCLGAGAM